MATDPEITRKLSAARKALSRLATYHATLTDAILAVEDAVKAAGLTLNPDDTGGLYCGEEGRATWGIVGTPRTVLFSWYRMQSGRFEQVSYIS